MSRKVKITRDQAEAIDTFRKTVQRLGVTAEELKDVFVSGYEVETEYSAGDWVHNNVTGRVAKIDDRGHDEEVAWVDDDEVNFFTEFRHATPSEIAAEKERRFWEKHGRDVWELREDDILDYLGDLLIVDSFDSEEVYFKSNKHDSSPNKYSETPSYVQKNFKVVALAENRLDVSE